MAVSHIFVIHLRQENDWTLLLSHTPAAEKIVQHVGMLSGPVASLTLIIARTTPVAESCHLLFCKHATCSSVMQSTTNANEAPYRDTHNNLAPSQN